MILKPENLDHFEISERYIDDLNIEMLFNCLNDGEYNSHKGGCHLSKNRADRYNKSSYDYLPKAFKYATSEKKFNSYSFEYRDFYPYGTTNVTEIKIDYCEYILNIFPKAKKTLRFYNKLKVEHPEYFV